MIRFIKRWKWTITTVAVLTPLLIAGVWWNVLLVKVVL